MRENNTDSPRLMTRCARYGIILPLFYDKKNDSCVRKSFIAICAAAKRWNGDYL